MELSNILEYSRPIDDLRITLQPVVSAEEIADRWLDLERRSDCSFFQSWAWIGCWLRHLPADLVPNLVTVSVGRIVVGLGVLVARRRQSHTLLNARTVYLNETGDPKIDPLGLEYNGFLADRATAAPVVEAFMKWFASQQRWDELVLGGLNPTWTQEYMTVARGAGLAVRALDSSPCYHVDLEAIRQSGGDYLMSLSRNTRYQIRRAMRLYATGGSLSIAAAADADKALRFFDGLRDLHEKSWAQRGQSGAFANQTSGKFHADLVLTRFDNGEIQLLRVCTGSRVIGYLYNLVKGGMVHAYQSGFRYDSDPRLKPGLICHALAIDYNIRSGAGIYDFMAGESQYKKSLGTRTDSMMWLVVYRNVLKLRVGNFLRELKTQLSTGTGNSGE